MFTTVLVANRGEIACRVITALAELGVASVAVYSDADAGARHVALADTAVRLGPAPAEESYLNAAAILAAARETGADAIHPGYGFLAENADFARACAAAGIVFIGPGPQALETMGDKIRAKDHVASRGVPVVPGAGRAGLTDAELLEAVTEVGFPLLIKPSAGGGGTGMHIVREAPSLPGALARARREALAAFGEADLLLERLIDRPRHIEVQILADTHGHVIHVGERECSLQRRHQKIIEEAPSPALDPHTRRRIGAAAIEAARSVDYVGAGTVEFIAAAADPETFFFMEMNTRLQVEHPVTEAVTGLDLVQWQVRIAAGERLTLHQDDVRPRGHAIEARVYAEDPAAGFLPTGGRIHALRTPAGPGIRVDHGLRPGQEVGAAYDPMLAKVIAHGPDRAGALRRLRRALADTAVVGVGTNVEYLRALLDDPRVRSGDLDTELAETFAFTPAAPDDHARAAAGLLLGRAPTGGPRAWDDRDGWRLGEAAGQRWEFAGHHPLVLGPGARLEALGPHRVSVSAGGRTRAYDFALEGPTVHLVRQGAHFALTPAGPERGEAEAGAGPDLLSPMPGRVTAIEATEGALIEEGAVIVVIEAMKMEHPLRAPHRGRVGLRVEVGQQVRARQVLATVTPEGGP